MNFLFKDVSRFLEANFMKDVFKPMLKKGFAHYAPSTRRTISHAIMRSDERLKLIRKCCVV